MASRWVSWQRMPTRYQLTKREAWLEQVERPGSGGSNSCPTSARLASPRHKNHQTKSPRPSSEISSTPRLLACRNASPRIVSPQLPGAHVQSPRRTRSAHDANDARKKSEDLEPDDVSRVVQSPRTGRLPGHGSAYVRTLKNQQWISAARMEMGEGKLNVMLVGKAAPMSYPKTIDNVANRHNDGCAHNHHSSDCQTPGHQISVVIGRGYRPSSGAQSEQLDSSRQAECSGHVSQPGQNFNSPRPQDMKRQAMSPRPLVSSPREQVISPRAQDTRHQTNGSGNEELKPQISGFKDLSSPRNQEMIHEAGSFENQQVSSSPQGHVGNRMQPHVSNFRQQQLSRQIMSPRYGHSATARLQDIRSPRLEDVRSAGSQDVRSPRQQDVRSPRQRGTANGRAVRSADQAEIHSPRQENEHLDQELYTPQPRIRNSRFEEITSPGQRDIVSPRQDLRSPRQGEGLDDQDSQAGVCEEVWDRHLAGDDEGLRQVPNTSMPVQHPSLRARGRGSVLHQQRLSQDQEGRNAKSKDKAESDKTSMPDGRQRRRSASSQPLVNRDDGSYMSHLRKAYLSGARDLPKTLPQQTSLISKTTSVQQQQPLPLELSPRQPQSPVEQVMAQRRDYDRRVGRILDYYAKVDVCKQLHGPRPPDAPRNHPQSSRLPGRPAFMPLAARRRAPRATAIVLPDKAHGAELGMFSPREKSSPRPHSSGRQNSPRPRGGEMWVVPREVSVALSARDHSTTASLEEREVCGSDPEGFVRINVQARLHDRQHFYLCTPGSEPREGEGVPLNGHPVSKTTCTLCCLEKEATCQGGFRDGPGPLDSTSAFPVHDKGFGLSRPHAHPGSGEGSSAPSERDSADRSLGFSPTFLPYDAETGLTSRQVFDDAELDGRNADRVIEGSEDDSPPGNSARDLAPRQSHQQFVKRQPGKDARAQNGFRKSRAQNGVRGKRAQNSVREKPIAQQNSAPETSKNVREIQNVQDFDLTHKGNGGEIEGEQDFAPTDPNPGARETPGGQEPIQTHTHQNDARSDNGNNDQNESGEESNQLNTGENPDGPYLTPTHTQQNEGWTDEEGVDDEDENGESDDNFIDARDQWTQTSGQYVDGQTTPERQNYIGWGSRHGENGLSGLGGRRSVVSHVSGAVTPEDMCPCDVSNKTSLSAGYHH